MAGYRDRMHRVLLFPYTPDIRKPQGDVERDAPTKINIARFLLRIHREGFLQHVAF